MDRRGDWQDGCTMVSWSSMRIIVVPLGKMDNHLFHSYLARIRNFQLLCMQQIPPFAGYKSEDSVFKYQYWLRGFMRLSIEVLKPEGENEQQLDDTWTTLKPHKGVIGVIALLHCPSNKDLTVAFRQYQNLQKRFASCIITRCWAFEILEAQMENQSLLEQMVEDGVEIFPHEHELDDGTMAVDFHMESVITNMCSILMKSFESKIRSAQLSMHQIEKMGKVSSAPSDFRRIVQGNTYPGDSSSGAGGSSSSLSNPLMDSKRRKKQLGRLHSWIASYCMLAGCPKDAAEHFSVAINASQSCGDTVWLAVSYSGLAAALYARAHAEEIGSVLAPSGQFQGARGEALLQLLSKVSQPMMNPKVVESLEKVISILGQPAMKTVPMVASLYVDCFLDAGSYLGLVGALDETSLSLNKVNGKSPSRPVMSTCTAIVLKGYRAVVERTDEVPVLVEYLQGAASVCQHLGKQRLALYFRYKCVDAFVRMNDWRSGLQAVKECLTILDVGESGGTAVHHWGSIRVLLLEQKEWLLSKLEKNVDVVHVCFKRLETLLEILMDTSVLSFSGVLSESGKLFHDTISTSGSFDQKSSSNDTATEMRKDQNVATQTLLNDVVSSSTAMLEDSIETKDVLSDPIATRKSFVDETTQRSFDEAVRKCFSKMQETAIKLHSPVHVDVVQSSSLFVKLTHVKPLSSSNQPRIIALENTTDQEQLGTEGLRKDTKSSSPFIFSPFSNGHSKEQDKTTTEEIPKVWVTGEVATVSLSFVSNFPDNLELKCIELVTEPSGVLEVQQGSTHVLLSSTPSRALVEVRPVQARELRIKGCRFTVGSIVFQVESQNAVHVQVLPRLPLLVYQVGDHSDTIIQVGAGETLRKDLHFRVVGERPIGLRVVAAQRHTGDATFADPVELFVAGNCAVSEPKAVVRRPSAYESMAVVVDTEPTVQGTGTGAIADLECVEDGVHVLKVPLYFVGKIGVESCQVTVEYWGSQERVSRELQLEFDLKVTESLSVSSIHAYRLVKSVAAAAESCLDVSCTSAGALMCDGSNNFSAVQRGAPPSTVDDTTMKDTDSTRYQECMIVAEIYNPTSSLYYLESSPRLGGSGEKDRIVQQRQGSISSVRTEAATNHGPRARNASVVPVDNNWLDTESLVMVAAHTHQRVVIAAKLKLCESNEDCEGCDHLIQLNWWLPESMTKGVLNLPCSKLKADLKQIDESEEAIQVSVTIQSGDGESPTIAMCSMSHSWQYFSINLENNGHTAKLALRVLIEFVDPVSNVKLDPMNDECLSFVGMLKHYVDEMKPKEVKKLKFCARLGTSARQLIVRVRVMEAEGVVAQCERTWKVLPLENDVTVASVELSVRTGVAAAAAGSEGTACEESVGVVAVDGGEAGVHVDTVENQGVDQVEEEDVVGIEVEMEEQAVEEEEVVDNQLQEEEVVENLVEEKVVENQVEEEVVENPVEEEVEVEVNPVEGEEEVVENPVEEEEEVVENPVEEEVEVEVEVEVNPVEGEEEVVENPVEEEEEVVENPVEEEEEVVENPVEGEEEVVKNPVEEEVVENPVEEEEEVVENSVEEEEEVVENPVKEEEEVVENQVEEEEVVVDIPGEEEEEVVENPVEEEEEVVENQVEEEEEVVENQVEEEEEVVDNPVEEEEEVEENPVEEEEEVEENPVEEEEEVVENQVEEEDEVDENQAKQGEEVVENPVEEEEEVEENPEEVDENQAKQGEEVVENQVEEEEERDENQAKEGEEVVDNTVEGEEEVVENLVEEEEVVENPVEEEEDVVEDQVEEEEEVVENLAEEEEEADDNQTVKEVVEEELNCTQSMIHNDTEEDEAKQQHNLKDSSISKEIDETSQAEDTGADSSSKLATFENLELASSESEEEVVVANPLGEDSHEVSFGLNDTKRVMQLLEVSSCDSNE